MSISNFASNCFTADSQQKRMPYLATPEALDNSTHSSSTNTHSRAKMNTPAPTPSTVSAICGERDGEPCILLSPGRGAGEGLPSSLSARRCSGKYRKSGLSMGNFS